MDFVIPMQSDGGGDNWFWDWAEDLVCIRHMCWGTATVCEFRLLRRMLIVAWTGSSENYTWKRFLFICLVFLLFIYLLLGFFLGRCANKHSHQTLCEKEDRLNNCHFIYILTYLGRWTDQKLTTATSNWTELRVRRHGPLTSHSVQTYPRGSETELVMAKRSPKRARAGTDPSPSPSSWLRDRTGRAASANRSGYRHQPRGPKYPGFLPDDLKNKHLPKRASRIQMYTLDL